MSISSKLAVRPTQAKHALDAVVLAQTCKEWQRRLLSTSTAGNTCLVSSKLNFQARGNTTLSTEHEAACSLAF
eukprot:267295-Amphidinium_carterae.1